jgi:hypothetical protein
VQNKGERRCRNGTGEDCAPLNGKSGVRYDRRCTRAGGHNAIPSTQSKEGQDRHNNDD